MAGLGRKTWTAGEVVTAANVQSYLQDQVVQVYAGTAARSSALGTAVSEGMISYLTDTNALEFYNGSAWAGVSTTSLASSAITTAYTDKSSSYTLVAGDKNTYIRSTGSAITITVPDVLANGESVNFIQAGAGQITFAGSGVTIYSVESKLKTNKQYSGATITKIGGAYYLVGDLAA
jgi:hypothetical protein